MSEHADFINGLHVVAYELQRVIGELDGMQDRLGISGLDRVSLDPLQWALSKLADDLHDASAELRDARLDVVLARGDASEARATQKNEQLQSLSVFNELRHELETVKAERDSLKQQRDDLDKSFVQSMQPTMASVVQLVEAAKATAVEVTKKLGELPPEPAPESYEWQVGDEVKRDDGTIHTISQAIGGLLWFKDQTIGMSEQWWLAENGYQLHRKASDIQPQAPEPYDWQVGDEIECNGVTRRKVIDRREGWVFLEGVTSPLSQPDWELRRWKLHRKASDVPPEPAPEPYQWQVGDEVIRNGEVRSVEVATRAYVKLYKLYTWGAQSEWERAGWKLYRKATDLPDIPPLTEQQVAEFSAVTEPIDDSTGAGEGQS
jgi:hypothetical protein